MFYKWLIDGLYEEMQTVGGSNVYQKLHIRQEWLSKKPIKTHCKNLIFYCMSNS